MLKLTILVLALAGTEPAAAPGEAVPPAPAPTKTQAQLDKEIICINVVPTGSIIAKRVCQSRKKWRKLVEDQKRQADRVLDPSTQGQTPRE